MQFPTEIVTLVLDHLCDQGRWKDCENAILVNKTWHDAWYDCKRFWSELYVSDTNASIVATTLGRVRCTAEHLFIDATIEEDVERVLCALERYDQVTIARHALTDRMVTTALFRDLRCLSCIAPPTYLAAHLPSLESLRVQCPDSRPATWTTAMLPPGLVALDLTGNVAFEILDPSSKKCRIRRLSVMTWKNTTFRLHAGDLPYLEELCVFADAVDVDGENANVSVVRLHSVSPTTRADDIFEIFPGAVTCSVSMGSFVPRVLPPSLRNLDIVMNPPADERTSAFDWSASGLEHLKICGLRCKSIRCPPTIVSAAFRRSIVSAVSVPYLDHPVLIPWRGSFRVRHATKSVRVRDALPVE